MPKPLQIWLSVDLSAPVGSFALHQWQEGAAPKLLGELVTEASQNHTEASMDRLAELLTKTQLKLEAVDRFLTPIGPGSFTGLRLAHSMVKAFAFALKRPITTLNASEARWLSNGGKEAGAVLTHSTADKVVLAEFDETGRSSGEGATAYGALASEAPKIVLLDDKISPEKLPDAWRKKSRAYPLRAKHLAETAGRALSRKDHETPAEWIALSPEYLGTSIRPIYAGG